MLRTIVSSFVLVGLMTAPLFAQEAAPAVRGSQQPSVRQVAAKISEETGKKVLVTSALAGKLLTQADMTVTKDASVEEALTKLAKRLPDAIWSKVYLPAPTGDKRYTAEAVAQFAQAETGLFGRSEGSQINTVALLGKRMTADEAQPYIKGLGLEPYYVLMNRTATVASPMGRLAAFGDPSGGRGGLAIDALMKKLGVTNPKDIPNGEYDVTVADDSGNQVPAHIKVENVEGKSSIMIRMGSNP